MKEILLSFVQDLLENNRIPVHFITLPCEDISWMDYGLRLDILPDHKPDFDHNFLKELKENTIYHLLQYFSDSR